ncbi:MAG: response regulator [Candidatus Neomarinimicrobiota bacterium]|nr:MAG: response regulator [Candidatus Neomarinimicrobiota bacterium]
MTADHPTILIAEDDAQSLLYFSMVLRQEYRVETARSVDRALSLMKKQPPDLILLDLSLEGKRDGLDLVRLMRKHREWKQIPVIAATAHALKQDRDNCLKAGCDAYLAKPIPMKKLVDTVHAFL